MYNYTTPPWMGNCINSSWPTDRPSVKEFCRNLSYSTTKLQKLQSLKCSNFSSSSWPSLPWLLPNTSTQECPLTLPVMLPVMPFQASVVDTPFMEPPPIMEESPFGKWFHSDPA
ncbi:uncharacterized protein LOC110856480 [Folsomia candida]|uniref:Uncharacterized protein n=1 Tax=Folsomia candida TaxID=158441 RepID=A0A226DK35_FOLCA|nr:uncharacterized protein LOC110856480 [Folsomia candida]OXA45895.1 hypothetical protein Fcan01_19140 [Folsomia candida]